MTPAPGSTQRLPGPSPVLSGGVFGPFRVAPGPGPGPVRVDFTRRGPMCSLLCERRAERSAWVDPCAGRRALFGTAPGPTQQGVFASPLANCQCYHHAHARGPEHVRRLPPRSRLECVTVRVQQGGGGVTCGARGRPATTPSPGVSRPAPLGCARARIIGGTGACSWPGRGEVIVGAGVRRPTNARPSTHVHSSATGGLR